MDALSFSGQLVFWSNRFYFGTGILAVRSAWHVMMMTLAYGHSDVALTTAIPSQKSAMLNF